MKILQFSVTVEGLPDNAKDYRVRGDVCWASSSLLKQKYPDGKINVIVSGAEPVEPRPVAKEAA